ncbi:hypothetical protein PG996_012475 [Apiospora saccharicola]|uniref:Uncharacterized protein n=1 Tax=Apiospora saccharicola TaxID=335842 RepID=A0ABR1U2P4_9PEZI
MAPIIFRFRSCGHEEKGPMPHALWKKLQERKSLPGKLVVDSSLPCPPCSRSYEEYYRDMSAWLHVVCKKTTYTDTDDSSTDTSLLAELIWVRSSLEQQQRPHPPEAKRICALLALAATQVRERHVDRLETVLLGELAHGRNALTIRLADSLPFRPRAVAVAVAVGNRSIIIDRCDTQVKIVKGMERVVQDSIGRVGALRELVARAETSPHHLQQDYAKCEYDIAPRKIFGLFF